MHPSWKPFLESEFKKPYFKTLSEFLRTAYAEKSIYPKKSEVFSAFTSDLGSVKVVILGQDPYHGPGQAHGLAFSVKDGVPTPPSLLNIYKEIAAEFGRTEMPTSGNLSRWADDGVLLLNNTLTVEAHKAGSHRGRGWETFTEATVKYLSETRKNLVFLLWGRDARAKKPLIDASKHLVLESPHPSPLSAHSGFFGNNHFKKANDYLASHNLPPINW